MLLQSLPESAARAAPSFVSGDQVRVKPDQNFSIEGRAMLRKHSVIIRADRLDYDQAQDLAQARGNVRILRSGNLFTGPALDLHVDAFEGFMETPSYEFLKNSTQGRAERIEFLDEHRAVAKNASLSSCRAKGGPEWLPDWVLTATRIKLDNETQQGEADGAVVRFKGVPILAVPKLAFPLGDNRQSGFLPPAINLSNISGLEYTQPYYWNIAPNRDATISPTLMTKRGIDVAGEYRYLEPTYSGTVRGNLAPADRLRDTTRWGLSAQHRGQAYVGSQGLSYFLDVNRVSDDDYWRDFPRAGVSLTQRLLPSDISVFTTVGAVALSARTLAYQTLQDPTSPITPPYNRLPQLSAKYVKSNWNGFDLDWSSDFTAFSGDSAKTLQPNARRFYSQFAVSRPWTTPGWFLVPKLQLNLARYGFDAPLADGRRKFSRSLATLSLDAGMVLERPFEFLGRKLTQTLEPRAFYVRTPFRNQSVVPNYDSAANDFNFATIYSENAFGGQDRISDSNTLTLGVTTRMLAADSGAELARFQLAQRLRLSDQRVALYGAPPITERVSDLLLGATVNGSARWAMDATVQYNQDIARSVRATVGARYTAGNYRVVSAAYRLVRGASEQIDVGWQWPLDALWRRGEPDAQNIAGQGLGDGRWYTVGRMNYSRTDKKLIDGIWGFEYDAGCWVMRLVAERTQRGNNGLGGTVSTSANKRILFQLEFVGFSRLGNNPLSLLQANVPRYQLLRERITTPSRFSTYE